MGGLAQNPIGWHTIQKGQLMPYYGVSHWGVARDGSGKIGP